MRKRYIDIHVSPTSADGYNQFRYRAEGYGKPNTNRPAKKFEFAEWHQGAPEQPPEFLSDAARGRNVLPLAVLALLSVTSEILKL